MAMKRVLLGFSGGIDSCSAVDILRTKGYAVTALTLDMMGDQKMIEKARKAARVLGVEFRVEDVKKRFKEKIVDYFVDEYMQGRTPAPCTMCNPLVKWHALYEIAVSEGYDHIATGHYFRIKAHNNHLYVVSGRDTLKDQSYYLWALNQSVLSMALTPMGDVIKSEIRQQRGVPETERESMGVCFLHGHNYGEFLLSQTNRLITPGEIVDKNGEVVALHQGYPLYTIGQKRGLGLPQGGCVIAIDAQHNRLIAGSDSDLYHYNLVLGNYVITDMDELLNSNDIEVKIRGLGRNPEGYCRVHKTEEGLHIELDSAAWASALGQPVVLYIGERVIGGGILERYY